ncbi:unnamed protein product [Cunninghamella blakesleeana]
MLSKKKVSEPVLVLRRSRRNINYNERSDSEEEVTHKTKRQRTAVRKRKSKKDNSSDSGTDRDAYELDSKQNDKYKDEEDEDITRNKKKSKLLATLPARRRANDIKSINSGSKPKSKRKLAAAAKRTIRRVNSSLPTITALRKVDNQSEALTAYELARERLHVSAVPDSLPCRENEFEEISSYVESALEEGTGTYISGVPGTGKTATVLEVMRGLQYRSEQGEIPPFDFVEINGMKLTDPNQAYSILWNCLNYENDGKKKITSNHALELLESRFSGHQHDNEKTTVVLMDELDLLVTKKQTVMYNFFEWPNRPNSKLIVVAIANTMDLPERMLNNKISSRMGLTRINFQAYTHQELYEIVVSRLHGIEAFESDAVEFAARKVSAVSGDARRALDICRRSVEIVEQRLAAATIAETAVTTTSVEKNQNDNNSNSNNNSNNNSINNDGKKKSTNKNTVTISVINEAIKEMFSSPSVAFIQSCSLHQKLFLVSVMQRIRTIGIAEIEFGDVSQYHLQTCKWYHIEPPTTSDLMRICESLGQSRALVVEGGRMDLGMKITLNLAEEDIIMACKEDRTVGRLLAALNK